MKKITLFTIMVVLLLSGAIYSCNGFEDFDFNESTALTDEAQALKVFAAPKRQKASPVARFLTQPAKLANLAILFKRTTERESNSAV